MKGRGLLLLDRDGTVIVEKHYLSRPDQVELLPGVAEGLRQLRELGYALGIVTNQSGVGRGYYSERNVQAVHDRMCALLEAETVHIDGIWHCPHAPMEACACRKPATGMLDAAIAELGYLSSECTVVGDKECDIELGRNAGARSVLVRTGYGRMTEAARHCVPDLVVDDIRELAQLETAALDARQLEVLR